MRGTLPVRPGGEPYQRRTLDQVGYVVVHHTQAGPGRPTALAVAQYQTGPTSHNDFPEIAYHLYVEADGTIEQVQDLEAVTWNAGQTGDEVIDGVSVKNWRGVAICFSGDEPTPEQIAGIKRGSAWVDEQLGRRVPRVGHGDLSSTECPGATWPQWRGQL